MLTRPGRNDPCYCGSGKKYKRCCLDIDAMPGRHARSAVTYVSAPESQSPRTASERTALDEQVAEGLAPAAPPSGAIDIDHMTEAELIDLNHRIAARVQFLRRVATHSSMREFRVGERVRFHPDDRPSVVGMITRHNRKTVTVITDEGQRWNVAPQLLERAVGAGDDSPERIVAIQPKR
jgi:hypothetical protein